MKKAYSKPEIIFEDFTLNKSIAGDCEVKTYTPAREQCGIEFVPGMVIFLETIGGCDTPLPEGSYDMCYHVPDASSLLFNS